jgi:carbohydrate diacid regulator
VKRDHKEEQDMSSRIFQSVILQMKDATDRCLGVIDAEGCVVAASEPSLIGEKWETPIMKLSAATEPLVTCEKKTFKPLANWSAHFDYAAFASGEDECARTLCMMAAVALNGAKSHYEEKFDKGTFVKNIITDNILPGDIYIRAKELHFVTDVPRAVFLVRQIGRVDVAAVDILQNMFADKQQDFVLSINETDIAVIKQVSPGVDSKEMVKLAQQMEETLNAEIFVKTVIGIGTVANHLRELADCYKEAQVAIEVGKVFDTECSIINYENLGIGRLIYQLPTTLCEIFLSEVFKKNSIDSLDQETLFTINKFFENNLNVSETSRKLFVHRNTLVYRLEKIKKLTGLDLREFDHAIIFKVALMVKKYLDSRDNSLLR